MRTKWLSTLKDEQLWQIAYKLGMPNQPSNFYQELIKTEDFYRLNLKRKYNDGDKTIIENTIVCTLCLQDYKVMHHDGFLIMYENSGYRYIMGSENNCGPAYTEEVENLIKKRFDAGVKYHKANKEKNEALAVLNETNALLKS